MIAGKSLLLIMLYADREETFKKADTSLGFKTGGRLFNESHLFIITYCEPNWIKKLLLWNIKKV